MRPGTPVRNIARATADIVVVGGGFAGSVLTAALQTAGFDTLTIDRAERYPDAFRSEKLEPDQSKLLRRFDLLDKVCTPDGELKQVDTYERGRVLTCHYEDHYSIRYDDTVNTLREVARDKTRWTNARVEEIYSDARGVTARTTDGDEVSGKLCVVASGRPSLLAQSGVEVDRDPGLTSLTFGFDVEAGGDEPLRAFNYNSESPGRDHAHYATLFPIGDAWRFNVFTSWSLDEKRTRLFARQPVESLYDLFPRMQEFTGPLRATTRVQLGHTVWHRVRQPSPDGVVVIGEAYQSVSPATGTGLSKCLTDIHVLLRHLAMWRQHDCVPGSAIDAFYQDPEKVAADDRSRDGWRWFHDCAHGRSLRAHLRRSGLLHAANRIAMMGQNALRRTS